MQDVFARERLLIGKDNLDKLASSRVAVFGIGGVGSFAVEALARGGVGNLVLVDDDIICLTNINRQLIALSSTVGKYKVDVMKERLLDINNDINVDNHKSFFSESNVSEFAFETYDYILDAIDTVSSKLTLIEIANKLNIPIISCMGAGNKLDPTAFEVSDIYKTSVCPLARVMRNELRKRNILKLKVVYSKETPLTPMETELISCKSNYDGNADSVEKLRRQIPGSISFVPPVAGMIAAGEIIKDLINFQTVKMQNDSAEK